MKEKFYFFNSFKDTIDSINDLELQREYMKAIIDYGLTGDFDRSNQLVNILMVQTCFTINRSEEISQSASERGKKGGAPKGNKNAVKNYENISKQPKTSKNKLKQTKTSEEEVEVEEEVEIEKNIDDKSSIKKPSALDDVLKSFVEMRKKIRKPITETGLELVKQKVQKMYPDREDLQIMCINKSIENSRQGVFSLSTEDIKLYKTKIREATEKKERIEALNHKVEEMTEEQKRATIERLQELRKNFRT